MMRLVRGDTVGQDTLKANWRQWGLAAWNQGCHFKNKRRYVTENVLHKERMHANQTAMHCALSHYEETLRDKYVKYSLQICENIQSKNNMAQIQLSHPEY